MQDHSYSESFSKEERLRSRKIISHLIESGQSLSAYPLRLVWKKEKIPSSFPAQVAFAVPKKKFARAVDRNRIKRQMREVYRKNKSTLYTFLNKKDCSLALLLIFTGKEKPDYTVLENKITKLLSQLDERI
jgi:ribonuclease P protein component